MPHRNGTAEMVRFSFVVFFLVAFLFLCLFAYVIAHYVVNKEEDRLINLLIVDYVNIDCQQRSNK